MKKEKISLLLADVDGTLVDSQKRITERAAGAIKSLEAAKVSFAITSGRPPKGMEMLSAELNKETGLSFTGNVPTSYAAVVEAMCADRVDVGWVSPLAYILAHDKCGADMTLV